MLQNHSDVEKFHDDNDESELDPTLVAKVVRRRTVRYTSASRALPQTQAFYPQFTHDLIHRCEKRAAKVAVMISIGGFLLYSHWGSVFRFIVGLGDVKNRTRPPT